MADIAKISVEKLNNSNYQTWKYEAELVLRRENTWFAVTTDPPAATEKGYEAWTQADSKAIGTIGLLVEKGQHVHTRPAKSAKEAWENLKKHHEKASLSSTVHLYTKLANTKLAENGNVESILHEIECILDHLVAVGEPVTKKLKIGMMLGSLPSSYGTLITALECRAENDLTVEMVREKILGEYTRRRTANEGTQELTETALKIKKETWKKDKKEKKRGLKCVFCHKQGHIQEKCYKYLAQLQLKNTGSEKQQTAKIVKQIPEKSEGGSSKSSNDSELFCFKTSMGDQDAWYVDSGASCHLTNNKSYYNRFNKNVCEIITLADGRKTKSEGAGDITLSCSNDNGNVKHVQVKSVRYVPNLDCNLLSVRALTSRGIRVNFLENRCEIISGDVIVGTADAVHGLFKLRCTQKVLMTTNGSHEKCIHTWHRRFGHRNPEAIKLLESKSMACGIKIEKCNERFPCETCTKGKFTRLPFPKKSSQQSKIPLDLIHSDLCGPMQTRHRVINVT